MAREKVEKLSSCLDKEIKIYEEILKLVAGERDLLIQNQEDGLKAVLAELQQKITAIQEQEEIRLGLGKESKDAEIGRKKDRIKQLVLQISEINNNNVFLIDQGRKSIKAFLDLMLDQYEIKTYVRNGKYGDNSKKNILLDKRL